jgi:hypothetical protein
MKTLKLGGVATLALLLTACPGDDRRVDDPTLDAPTVAPPDEPAVTPAAAQRTELEAVTGVGITGHIEALPRDNSTEIWVHVVGGPPNESLGVRVHSGTCQSPGPELARISAIGTDNAGMGESRTDVGHAPHLIMDGNHIVAVHAPGADPERDQPLACATIPQHGAGMGPGMTAPGTTTPGTTRP